LDISIQEKGRIAKAVIDAFPENQGNKRHNRNRPLLAAIAIYVAENPGASTQDVVTHFKFHGFGKSHNAALTNAGYYLKCLNKAGILKSKKESRFVPKKSTVLASGEVKVLGLNKPVKNHTAVWSIAEPSPDDELQTD
jgi:hypothetical protein